ncbi:uncharacterized protein N7487_010927 [Penicillium crustosum]|uniref:uncharacterized protein n=1 Tax=Penicillium crustosum TaxID=36656 RepID=UPI0023909752|nr:uncharacterized protein N7487_010927 [Penicillium crustosum]KAJ5393286.1 hypothetical protein N7487_010927 [Penicillium crustosum]
MPMNGLTDGVQRRRRLAENQLQPHVTTLTAKLIRQGNIILPQQPLQSPLIGGVVQANFSQVESLSAPGSCGAIWVVCLISRGLSAQLTSWYT